MKITILKEKDMLDIFSMKDTMAAVSDAMKAYSEKRCNIPLRVNIDVPEHHGQSLYMPGYVSDLEALGMKIVSVYPGNVDKGLTAVPAMMALLNDIYAKGSITGLTRGTTAGHIARAALEGIAFQTMDIARAMQKDAGIKLAELKVDGGASKDNLLMQFQADILGTKVIRPKVTETTAEGAAYLAGLAVGYWNDLDEINKYWQADKEFIPSDASEKIASLQAGWAEAVERTLTKK